MEKKIYLIKFDNGEEYDDYEEYTYPYCYSDLIEVQQEIEKLKKNIQFFDDKDIFKDTKAINIWYEQVTLIEK